MEYGCHTEDIVYSLAVQKQKLIVEQWDIWVEKNCGGRKHLNTEKVNVDFHRW